MTNIGCKTFVPAQHHHNAHEGDIIKLTAEDIEYIKGLVLEDKLAGRNDLHLKVLYVMDYVIFGDLCNID